MAGFLFRLSALQILLVQGLPLDTFTTASHTAAYGHPQQYAGKSSVWADGSARNTDCPHGTYTGGSCYVRDDDEPTPSTLYQPETPTPASSLTAATSYVNGTGSEDCTTGEDSASYSTGAPIGTYSSFFQIRPEVTRTAYPQQSSESVPSHPQTPSSDSTSENQGQYAFSDVKTTFGNQIISTTWDAFPTSFSSRSDTSYVTKTYTAGQYDTVIPTLTDSRSHSYGTPVTTWTDMPTFTSDDSSHTSEAYARPVGYGDGSSLSYDTVNSNTGTRSFFSFTNVVADPTQTVDPITETVAFLPTLSDQPTNSYFYGQPLPSMSSIYDDDSGTKDPYASQSHPVQPTQPQRSAYPDAGNPNTYSLGPPLTRSATPDTVSSRQTVYPNPTSSFKIIRDPIATASEFSYTTWSQRTIYPDPSVSFTVLPQPSTSQIDLPWSTRTNYPAADNSNTAGFDPTHTQSDFFQPTQSDATIFPTPMSSDTFVWDPTLIQTELWSQYTVYPESSHSYAFTWDPTLTQTESWSQYTAYPGPSSSSTFFPYPTLTRSTSLIYPTAYWQPRSDRSDLPTATPVRDPNSWGTTFVTVTRTAFQTISSGSNYGLPSYHHHAGVGWPFGFWHRLSRSFSRDHGHEVAAWGRDRDSEPADNGRW